MNLKLDYDLLHLVGKAIGWQIDEFKPQVRRAGGGRGGQAGDRAAKMCGQAAGGEGRSGRHVCGCGRGEDGGQVRAGCLCAICVRVRGPGAAGLCYMPVCAFAQRPGGMRAPRRHSSRGCGSAAHRGLPSLSA